MVTTRGQEGLLGRSGSQLGPEAPSRLAVVTVTRVTMSLGARGIELKSNCAVDLHASMHARRIAKRTP